MEDYEFYDIMKPFTVVDGYICFNYNCIAKLMMYGKYSIFYYYPVSCLAPKLIKKIEHKSRTAPPLKEYLEQNLNIKTFIKKKRIHVPKDYKFVDFKIVNFVLTARFAGKNGLIKKVKYNLR